MYKHKIILLIITLLSFSYSACQKESATPPSMLEIEEADKSINLPAEATLRSVSIKTNVDKWTATADQDWCKVNASYAENPWLDIDVSSNTTFDLRKATISIQAAELSEQITVTQLGTKPTIVLNERQLMLNLKAQQLELKVTSNVIPEVSFSQEWMRIAENKGLKGTKVDLVDYNFKVEVDQLANDVTQRQGKVFFKNEAADICDSVIITQSLTIEEYIPEDTNAFEKDKKITIQGATLTPSDKYQSGEDITKAIDGQTSTMYHSPWSGMSRDTELTMEFALDQSEDHIANYIVLHPRTSGPNGIIKSATIWANTLDDDTYQQVGVLEAPLSNNPAVVRFELPIIRPKNIKIVVTDAYGDGTGNYYVSLAEFECYESKSMKGLEQDQQFFTDLTFSELQPGTTIADVADIQNPFLQNIAAYLLAGEYPAEYRVQNYKPYREVGDLASELKTSAYSQFENMTGMYFSTNEEVVVFAGEMNGEKVSLRVTDFGQSGNDYSYPLSEGLNVITMKGKGNGYLSYYTNNHETANSLKVHIASGQVNGYFDSSLHSEEEGKALLDNAVSTIMDIRGEYVHLAYSVSSLNSQCYGRMGELIGIYDDLIGLQYAVMGLDKYNRIPKNRMFGRVIWSGYMHADGWGAAFHDDTMGDVANPDNVRNNNWGIAHEFGHVNQVRPGMKWVGTSECTNNIYSVWSQYTYTPTQLRLEHENVGGTIGGRFNAFLNNGLVKGQEWGLQAGPDKGYGSDENGEWGADHFVKLVPLWQLHLYFHVAGEGNSWHRPYFWADIFETVRQTDESAMSDGEMQINFIKNMCDAVQYDLSDFFIKIGMLKEVDKYFGDYTSAQKTITQSMIDEAVSYASRYVKPESDHIYYISGNCIDAYKNKQQVSGTFNTGISGTTSKTISHAEWQNVVVFETYEGDQITDITMVGTGSSSNSSTKVPYPSGSTRIEAVSYDGTKTLVLGTR
ncbi:M60 family metallopeptidase [Carboxylicivirga marina]|uniref:Peptidase M60 domain-containing protein n=1 Tax=Carboxylicivirga marina TaxID=2800988 RepID=A0ABS1HEZ3_9BACT|nr:M60 family metallopeptidase [Carboxylicivirga marina]MBK3516181.1 hypothetical protein [Carboxylicivirga marina]